MLLFIRSVYVLSTSYIPDTVLGSRHKATDPQKKKTGPHETYISVMERETNMENKILHIVNRLVMNDMKKRKAGEGHREE